MAQLPLHNGVALPRPAQDVNVPCLMRTLQLRALMSHDAVDVGMDAARFKVRAKGSMTLVFIKCIDLPGELQYTWRNFRLAGVIDGPVEVPYSGPVLYDLVVQWFAKHDPMRDGMTLSIVVCDNTVHHPSSYTWRREYSPQDRTNYSIQSF
jgi:hypothetical protein